jgi:hypothetical protein
MVTPIPTVVPSLFEFVAARLDSKQPHENVLQVAINKAQSGHPVLINNARQTPFRDVISRKYALDANCCPPGIP